MSNRRINHNHSRLYGLYIHNLTKHPNKTIALETISKFLAETPPLKYEYGDVVVVQPDNEIGNIMRAVLSKNGFITEIIAPNQLYRLMDRLIMHYVFTDKMISQQQSEKFVYDWEISMKLSPSDLRHTRYIKTFFMD